MPGSILNRVKQKESENFTFDEKSIQKTDGQQTQWYTEITINQAKMGEAIDTSKKTSHHMAALNVFHNMFPKGSTWR